MQMRVMGILVGILTLMSAITMGAENIKTGDLVVDPPTLICASFQWFGEGDDNRNATVTVEYRKTGEQDWSESMDLYRLDKVEEGLPLFAGSILDLEEDTEYECRLKLSDPDGVEGESEKLVTVRTWKEPMVPTENVEIRHVYPGDYKGEMEQPAFKTIKGALKGQPRGGWGSSPAPAGPGTVLKLHGGIYKGKPTDYRDINAQHFTGSLYFRGYSGAEGRPVALVAAGDGEVIIDGADAHVLFDLVGAKHVYFEGLTIRNCGIAFQLSDIPHAEPSEGITIKNCTVEDIRVVAYGGHPGNRRVYVGDNRFVGRQKAIVGSWGDFTSPAALGLAGRGHVVCYNSSRRFFDFFNNWGFYTGGSPWGRADHKDNSAVDVYNNDIQINGDNSVGMFPGVNLRCLRNFVLNAGDPQMDTRNNCGPIYYIRNVVWNQRADRAFKTDGTIHGLYAFHNTMSLYPTATTGYARVYMKNNLFLGAPEVKRGNLKPSMQLQSDQALEADYNGYKMEWADKEGPLWIYGDQKFSDFRKFTEAWGQEKHAVEVDFDIFEKPVNPHVLEATAPHSVHLIDEADLDLALKADATAVDAGVVIPNVNDGYNGEAPDLGVYEVGKEKPHYGPRMDATPPKVLKEANTDASKIPADPGEAVFRVNVGCAFRYEDPAGNIWMSDQKYKEGLAYGYIGSGGAVNRGTDVENTERDQVYNRERYGMEQYVFDLPSGDYIVRFHLAEGFFGGADERVFKIKANGKVALESVDIFKEGGGKNKAVFKDVNISVGAKGLALSFEKVKDNPSINGIEIFKQ